MNLVINSCQIKIASKYYYFGVWLTEVEQEWLVSEISSFINEINYSEDRIQNTRSKSDYGSIAVVEDWVATRQIQTPVQAPSDRLKEPNKISNTPLRTVSKLVRQQDLLAITIPSRFSIKPSSIFCFLFPSTISASLIFANTGSDKDVIFGRTIITVLLAIFLYLTAEYCFTSDRLKFTPEAFIFESRY